MAAENGGDVIPKRWRFVYIMITELFFVAFNWLLLHPVFDFMDMPFFSEKLCHCAIRFILVYLSIRELLGETNNTNTIDQIA